MIQDNQTNKLFLADCLPNKQLKFFPRFKKVLAECNIEINFLPNTKDIWAVDYMPIQVGRDKFIQFTYNPDYLKSKQYQKTISDVDIICKGLNIKTSKSNLRVDGGNVVKSANKVIMCDKVFHENKQFSEKEVIKQLIDLFEIEQLIFVPWDKYDCIGHADGMLRFINEDTVLINDYSFEDMRFQRSFRLALHNAGLNIVELPFNPTSDIKSISAKGIYMNYLQMQQAIILPVFKSKYDEKALKVIEEVFPGELIKTIESNELAKEGGILNCITWNVLV
jgi:agmatine deiminase